MSRFMKGDDVAGMENGQQELKNAFLQLKCKKTKNIKLTKRDKMEWFWKHGGLDKGINFPVRFEPGSYLGISACEQIKPNTVILAVPKQLTVSISRAKQSELKEIYKQYQIFAEAENDDSDYNILCLFLVMQKMKGPKSFFYDYIELLDSSETVMHWSDQEIEAINDPYINLKFIDSVRMTFDPVYETFVEIANKHPSLFPEKFTRQIFDEIYAAVMTRGFGWGLPETMLVPYADFLNHSSSGVNHYVFDKCLEQSKQPNAYIKKKHELNLTIFPSISNQHLLPVDYEPNIRQNYIIKNMHQLKEMNLSTTDIDSSTRMDPSITNPLYNMLTESLIEDGFDDEVYLSTDSEDNDSDSEAEGLEETEEIDGKATGVQPINTKLGTVLMARKYLRFAFKQVDKDLDERFTDPKPNVNAEFEQGVKFDWWHQHHQSSKFQVKSQDQSQQPQGSEQKQPKDQDQVEQKQIQQRQFSQQNQPQNKDQVEQKQDKYFIVSSSRKIYPNQQIYNCYGRRSNRFLLIWYGFCFQNNKYDSIPFRIWATQISKKTGHTIYTRFLTELQYKEGIPIGNQRYNAYMLSQEFRLKSRKIDYRLMAYLRYKFLIGNRIYKEHYKAKSLHVSKITAVHMEIQCLLEYQKHLNTLVKVFGFEIIQKTFEADNKLREMTQFSSGRDYFKSILQKSNEQIIIKNILAVNQLLKVLYEIETYLQKQGHHQKMMKPASKLPTSHINWQRLPKHLLLNLYQESFTQSQKQHPLLYRRLEAINYQPRPKLKRQLKIMVREYFRMLSSTEVCRTLYTDFE